MGIDSKTRRKMKAMYDAGNSCMDISKALGIAESIVRQIVLGSTSK